MTGGGMKRSLAMAGLLVVGATGYLFPVPSPSALSTTSTGQAIAARQAKHTLAATRDSSPTPRMATMMDQQQQQHRRERPASWATMEPARDASGMVGSSGGGTSIVDGLPDHIFQPSTVFQSVARSPRPGIVARDGTRDDGKRERDDGKSPDFEVNLGRVISTLREDYPRIFFDPPSFDIFTDEIELRDPTGVAFRGITNYKRVFATLRFFRQMFMNDASTTFRLTYDWSKQQVRVTWNIVLQLKARQRPIYVDGTSAYHINSNGLAYRHELETVVVNGTPVEPPFAYAWINLPAWVSRGASAKPAGAGAMPAPNGMVSSSRFKGADAVKGGKVELDLGLGSIMSAAQTDPLLREDFMSALNVLMATDDGEGLAKESRDDAEETKAGSGGAEGASSKEKKPARTIKGKKKDGWFGLQEKWECDTSFDCTGGMVCCDFLLVKVCCSNGIRQPKFGDLVPSLVPIPGKGRNENDTPVRRTPPRSRPSSGW